MAILVPRWLDFSRQVRLQMRLKFCMVKIANRTTAQTHSTITFDSNAAAHGANKVDFLVYTACTRVQTVSLDLYSCTGEMTPSIQVHTPDESTRTAVQPASL
jgi:hypothetical protein